MTARADRAWREHPESRILLAPWSEDQQKLVREVLVEALPRRDTHPALAALVADAEGHLWVKEWSDSESGVADQWSVFGPEGRWLGVVDGLSRCHALDMPCWIGNGFFLMVTHDDHGAVRVEVYAIRKAQGP